VSSTVPGALLGVGVCLAATPYLARLTRTVPDRENRQWWRGARASRGRVAATAAAAAALGALGGAAAGASMLLPGFLWLALTGAPLTVIDFEHHRLPNRLVYAAAIGAAVLLALAAVVRHDWADYLRAVEGAAAVFAVLFVVFFVAPRSFGRGDVRLGGILGGYLGWSGWATVYYGIFGGFVLGMLVSLGLLATRRASLKTALAFGPMLLFGALIVLAFDLTPTFGG
jgi:leader peptidase (prepilin peptidase) / N-methyltransferase